MDLLRIQEGRWKRLALRAPSCLSRRRATEEGGENKELRAKKTRRSLGELEGREIIGRPIVLTQWPHAPLLPLAPGNKGTCGLFPPTPPHLILVSRWSRSLTRISLRDPSIFFFRDSIKPRILMGVPILNRRE